MDALDRATPLSQPARCSDWSGQAARNLHQDTYASAETNGRAAHHQLVSGHSRRNVWGAIAVRQDRLQHPEATTIRLNGTSLEDTAENNRSSSTTAGAPAIISPSPHPLSLSAEYAATARRRQGWTTIDEKQTMLSSNTRPLRPDSKTNRFLLTNSFRNEHIDRMEFEPCRFLQVFSIDGPLSQTSHRIKGKARPASTPLDTLAGLPPHLHQNRRILCRG